jgi:hypothetical protein
MRRQLAGAAGILVVGFALITLAHLARPLGSLPLFDGLAVIEPYRWLDPPAPAAGATPFPSDPTSYSQPMTIKDGKIPAMFAGTSETPPQAQMFTSAAVFDVPPGTTEAEITVAPVRSSVAPPNGHITGNVYHFSITTPDGTEIPISAGKTVSIVLRVSQDETAVTIDRFDGQRWVPLQTPPLGVPMLYKTNATQLGDFAVVVPGAIATPAPLPAGQTPRPVPTPGVRAPAATNSAGVVPPTSGGGFSPALAVTSVVIAGVLVALVAAGLYFRRSRR